MLKLFRRIPAFRLTHLSKADKVGHKTQGNCKDLVKRYLGLKNRCFLLIATGLFIGYLPGAPGTYATIAVAFIYYFLPEGHYLFYTFLIALPIGIISADRSEKVFGIKDSRQIVIDEILGFWLAMCGLPKGWFNIVFGVIFFRLFDILKPFPIKRLESLSGGFGIVIDDLVAGLYTLIILKALVQMIKGLP